MIFHFYSIHLDKISVLATFMVKRYVLILKLNIYLKIFCFRYITTVEYCNNILKL